MPVLYTWAEYLRADALADLKADTTLIIRVPRVERRGTSLEVGAAARASIGSEREGAEALHARPASPLDEVERLRSLEATSVSQEAEDPVTLTETLLEHDGKAKQVAFDKGIHMCDVCLSELPGHECFR